MDRLKNLLSNNGKNTLLDEELKAEPGYYGIEFTLGTYSWIRELIYTDENTAKLQKLIDEDEFLFEDLVIQPSQLGSFFKNKDLDSQLLEIFYSYDQDFEIQADANMVLFYLLFKDHNYLLISNSRFDDIIVVKGEDCVYEEDYIFTFHLHGAEFSCHCLGDTLCSCSVDYCEASDTSSITIEQYSDNQSLIDAIRQRKKDVEFLIAHPKLPFGIDYESNFIGDGLDLGNTMLYDKHEEVVFCPNCLEEYNIKGAFNLYV